MNFTLNLLTSQKHLFRFYSSDITEWAINYVQAKFSPGWYLADNIQKQPFPGVSENRCSKKFLKIHRKTTVPESLFSKVALMLLHRYSPNNISI